MGRILKSMLMYKRVSKGTIKYDFVISCLTFRGSNPTKILFTNSCASLPIYQHSLMHISEPRTNLTLINHSIKVYELKRGPLEPIGQYRLLYNPIMNLTQHLIIETQQHSNTLCK